MGKNKRIISMRPWQIEAISAASMPVQNSSVYPVVNNSDFACIHIVFYQPAPDGLAYCHYLCAKPADKSPAEGVIRQIPSMHYQLLSHHNDARDGDGAGMKAVGVHNISPCPEQYPQHGPACPEPVDKATR
jgi:hypothetical protein